MSTKREAIKMAVARHENFMNRGINPPPIMHVIYEDEMYHVVMDKYFQDGGKSKSLYSTLDLVDCESSKFIRRTEKVKFEDVIKKQTAGINHE